jgi:FixJ family two-component response regulator
LSEAERARCGLVYVSAQDAADAFAKARATRFPVAIIDVDLGPASESGLALVRRLRALDPAMRICVHSDGPPFDLQRLVVEAGGDLFLPKPMAREHLLRLLRAEPRPSRPRIAIVEDDALMIESWESLAGYEWRAFESPAAFLSACDAEEALLPSLWCVITDQNFAGEAATGAALASELVGRRPDLPVFLASNLKLRDPPAAVRAVISKDPAAGIAEVAALMPAPAAVRPKFLS